jgi:putative RNA 2'-phosphotransferase
MTRQTKVRQSRFLSLVLRHKPEEAGITLDRHGWVQIDTLLRGMKRAGHGMTRDDLEKVVAENDKKRFTISSDGKRIRAAQGHSVDVDLGLDPVSPPEYLYHGTASASLDSIFASGLHPGKRKKVHLSPDPETAIRVGQRHGKPVVLRVETGKMSQDGHLFWRAENGVWLTDLVPKEYLGFGVLE